MYIANTRQYFVKKLGQSEVGKSLITIFYKSVIESILYDLPVVLVAEGRKYKGDRMQ